MKVVLVGSSGDVGSAIFENLSPDHEVVTVGRTSGELQVDLTDINSIELLYKEIGEFDALVTAIGGVKFAPFTEFTQEGYQFGLDNKLMGQINLVTQGIKHIKPQGSFTLTSGVLSRDPIRGASSAAMVNGAIDAFVISSAIEMPEGIRINSVSPTVLTESFEKFGNYFSGFESVPAARVARAYRKSIDGAQTGQIYRVE